MYAIHYPSKNVPTANSTRLTTLTIPPCIGALGLFVNNVSIIAYAIQSLDGINLRSSPSFQKTQVIKALVDGTLIKMCKDCDSKESAP